MHLTILYRGPLSSCNYACHYCPFAKQIDSQHELEQDRACLDKFVSWCEASDFASLRVFFTPWGEALTRHWYWSALERLSNLSHVKKVAAQTNLSCRLGWLEACDQRKIGFWATYHPSQVSLDRFLKKVHRLSTSSISHSVGMVGLREDFEAIEEMRTRLPTATYLWINAYKRQPDYYSQDDVQRLRAVDPLFQVNNTYHPSRGAECDTGKKVISVDGTGDIRRCHFVEMTLGNIYRDNLNAILKPRRCPNATCGCHIGYVHMPRLQLQSTFGDGILERVPVSFDSPKWRNGSACGVGG